MANPFRTFNRADLEIVVEALKSHHEGLQSFHDDEDTEPSPAFTHEVARARELYHQAKKDLEAR